MSKRGAFGPEASKRLRGLKLALLGLLAEKPRHAYELNSVIEQRHIREWADIGFSTIYQSLHSMRARGWLQARREKGARGSGKHVFSPTAKGRARLRADLRHFLSVPDDPVFATQLAGMFAAQLTQEEQADALRKFEVAADALTARLRERWRRARTFWRSAWQDAIFRHAVAHAEAESRWVRQTRRAIPGRSSPSLTHRHSTNGSTQ